MRLVNKIIFAFSLIYLSAPVIAAECSAKSGAATVPLLELYTSEGCSSCPPADKWLSSLKPNAKLFTLLAFHVDYWNYIGWEDRFSKAEYSERQRKIAAFNGESYVYTPQFVMNGRDFRGANDSRLNKIIEASQKLPSRANLSLDMLTQTQDEITLKVSAQLVRTKDFKNSDIKDSRVFVAIYENKLLSKINAGENNGRELKHDYVVRELFGAYQINSQNQFSKNLTLKPALINHEYQVENMGAVVFLQNSQNGEILQSLALQFCKH